MLNCLHALVWLAWQRDTVVEQVLVLFGIGLVLLQSTMRLINYANITWLRLIEHLDTALQMTLCKILDDFVFYQGSVWPILPKFYLQDSCIARV